MDARAVIAGPGAARALRDGATGRLMIALRGGGYVRLGTEDWLLITGVRAPLGPLSLVVAGLDGRTVRSGWRARCGGDALVLGPLRIALGGLELGGLRAAAGARAVDGAAFDAALAACPPPPAALTAGLVALRRGDEDRGVATLAGRGEGLTPAGDDVLAGYAAWRHAAGAPAGLAGRAAGRCSPIGLAYLRCADRGELVEPAAALLAALAAGDAPLSARRARALRVSWGASSGVALLWGMAAAAASPRSPS